MRTDRIGSGIDTDGPSGDNKPVRMSIADIEFQGSRVKVLLTSSEDELFNVLMNDSKFHIKELELGQRVS